MDRGEKKLLSLVIIVNNLIGLFKFRIKKFEQRGKGAEYQVQKSRLANAWSIILIVVILYTNYIVPIMDGWIYLQYPWFFVDIAKAIQVILGSLVVVVLWIYFTFQQKTLIRIAEKFIEFDNSLEKYRRIFQLTSFSNFVILITVIPMIMGIIAAILEHLIYVSYDKKLWSSWWYKYLFPHFVLMMFIMQYAIVIRTLRIRMESLNRGIVKLKGASYDFPNNFTIVGKMLTDKMRLQTFNSFKALHEKLYELCVEISELYSFPILPVLAYITYSVITLVYYLVITIIVFTTDASKMILLFLWLLILMSLALRLIGEIEKLGNEFKKIAPSAFQFLNSFPNDHLLKSAVRGFTQELMHKELVFTAYGFFNLDSTLFQSIFSSILTYSIIILQTQGSNHVAAFSQYNRTH